MRIRIKNNCLINIFRILSLIIFVVSIILWDINKCKYPYIILIFNYIIFIHLSSNNMRYKTPGEVVLNVVFFLRYVLLPFSYLLPNATYGFHNNFHYMKEAFLILVYEQIAIFIVMSIKNNKKNNVQNDDFLIDIKYGNIISIVVILLIVLLVIKHRYLVSGMSLITQGTVAYVEEDVKSVSGVVSVLWQAALAWLYIYIIVKIKKNNIFKKNKSINIVLVISLGYILLTFIGQSSISRWYTIISFVAVYFTLIKLFPEYKKKINLSVIVPVLLLMIVVTVYKNTSYLETDNHNFINSLQSLINSKSLESYFAGHIGVNNSLGLYYNVNISYKSFISDLLNNMPIVNHWIDNANASVNLYNSYIGRFWNGSGDQIIPLIGQSLLYFTPLFAPLLSCISVFLVHYFDEKFKNSNGMLMYVYAFTSSWIAVSTILNFTIILSWVYIRIIPLFCMIFFINALGLKKIKMKEKKNE